MLFGSKKQSWRTPGGDYYKLYSDIARCAHCLIAGTTGSGKSVLINGFIGTQLILNSPARAQFILVDPKRVELSDYRKLPHAIAYAADPDAMAAALRQALDIVEDRFAAMARRGEKLFCGPDLYVIIDELADLMTTDRKRVLPILQRIGQIGRAARVHLIAATQCPLAKVIPTELKVNFDFLIGLRTRSAQDSRNILDVSGCELLPRYGHAYIQTPDGISRARVPMMDPDRIAGLSAGGPARIAGPDTYMVLLKKPVARLRMCWYNYPRTAG